MVNNFIKKIMLNKLRKHIKEYNDKGLYTICTSQSFLEEFYKMESGSNMSKLLKLSKKCDSILPISVKDGRAIEELFESKDKVIGIYSASFNENELQSSQISKIIHEGINVNYKTFDIPDLNGKVYFCDNYIDAMYDLKNCCKHGEIEFILTFPRSLVDKDGNYLNSSFKHLFNVNPNGVYIKPDFIDSYVVYKQHMAHRISTSDFKKILINK